MTIGLSADIAAGPGESRSCAPDRPLGRLDADQEQVGARGSGSVAPSSLRCGAFVRSRLPDPRSYYDSEGLTLSGSGKWRTTRCEFHGGSDSMRINTDTGGWICMSCGEKGGDVLAYAMRRHGLEFVVAARSLGAYVEDGTPRVKTGRATTLSARDAMEVVAFELQVAVIVIGDIRKGLIPSDQDWMRFRDCAGRIEALAMEYRA